MTSVSPAVSSTADRTFAGRQTPWSNEAEQAILGAMLLDQDAALKAAELLDDTMFYKEGHRALFRAMTGLAERGDVIDPVTLRDELGRRGDLDRAGGMEYIGALIDVVPTAANVEYHCRIVRDKAVQRRLIEAATSIIQDVYDGHATAAEVLDNAEHRVPVAIFSLEMSKDQLVQRLLCSEGLVDAQRLRRGQLRDDDYPKLARAAGLLGTAPIWIDDSAALTPLAMRSKARRLKAEHDIALVVVDYLQLMSGPGDAENRQQEISYISRALKALAKELDVPVVAISQLSRAPEQRGGEHRRPQLSDLRESGAIEQDADVVCFIYRQEFYDGPSDPKTGDSIEGQAEVIVGKQRNGPTGTVKLYFKKEYTRFDNYTSRAVPEGAN